MKNREAYNKKVSLKKLHIESMVYLWDPQTEENRKLATYFHGPYEVLEIINDRKVKIKIGESTKTVARNRLCVVNAEDISSETIPLNLPIRRDTKNLKESDDYNYDDERQRPTTRQTNPHRKSVIEAAMEEWEKIIEKSTKPWFKKPSNPFKKRSNEEERKSFKRPLQDMDDSDSPTDQGTIEDQEFPEQGGPIPTL
ncbi:Hypothetical protein FKW44_013648 [Caligus rogercresseyi]|uniref:Uncharacterized protein n=1 Tax=Caligus rogercresseyi TaxID=217165 RepID=A0A7T8GXV8_CALRO|nr:Hypothetical protein FKW44_013648 [Caligus rogercresseyi]